MITREPITLRTVVMLLGGLFFGGLITLYVLFQARYLISGPQITLAEEPAIVQAERTVSLTGSTFNISRLWLNDRQIFTDPQGNFQETLVLENGYTIATLRAVDRYGRETTVSRPFVYRPASGFYQ